MTEKRIVEQLSIFVNNEPGSLAKIAQVMMDCNIEIKAFNIAESIGFGVLRTIVENPDDAMKKLAAKGIIVKKTEMIAIKSDEKPGFLFKISKALGDAGISIEYAYTNKMADGVSILIRVNDTDKTAKVLDGLGVKMLETKDL